MKEQFAKFLAELKNSKYTSHALNDQDFQTIGVQFSALGLIETRYTAATNGGMGLFWSLTPKGHRLMLETRTVRTGSPR